MLSERVKVTVVTDGVRYNGQPLSVGDQVEIEDHLVNDWLRAGVAKLGWTERRLTKSEERKLRQLEEQESAVEAKTEGLSAAPKLKLNGLRL